VKTEQRLALFYLLNDVVQNCKRKNFGDMLEKFEAILKEIMPYMKEDKICDKVQVKFLTFFFTFWYIFYRDKSVKKSSQTIIACKATLIAKLESGDEILIFKIEAKRTSKNNTLKAFSFANLTHY